MKYNLKDDKGRILIAMNEAGEMAVARYPDLDKALKEYLIDFYKEVNIGGDDGVEQLRKFLNFETDEEFCS